MNNAKQVAKLVEELAPQVLSGGVSLSEAGWQIALACVGWPYVFGAWGAECTVAERKKRYKAHPSHTTIKTACKAFDGGTCSGCKWYPDGERVRCFDCRGLTDWVLKQIGFDLQGEGATSQWNTAANWAQKGAVADGIPQGVLVCLFYEDKDSPKTMTHTGLYFNGETCECSNNVQHFKKANKKWTKWAVPACFAVEPQPEPGYAIVTGKRVALRKEPSKSAGIIMRIDTGEEVKMEPEPEKAWDYVSYKGKTGWMMREFLQEG